MSLSVPEFKAAPGTKARVKEIMAWLWVRFTYKKDDEEDWGNTLSQLRASGIIENDCDGWSRVLMALCFHWGGFKLADMAEVVVDTNLKDDSPYDHHIAAFWFGKRWKYSHCWVPRLVEGYTDRKGDMMIETGVQRSSMKPVKHRLVSTGTWYSGAPLHDSEIAA